MRSLTQFTTRSFPFSTTYSPHNCLGGTPHHDFAKKTLDTCRWACIVVLVLFNTRIWCNVARAPSRVKSCSTQRSAPLVPTDETYSGFPPQYNGWDVTPYGHNAESYWDHFAVLM